MSFTIALSSDLRENTNQPTHDFEIEFTPPITTYNKDGYKWAVGLIRANGWYSYFNISETKYQNSTFTYVDELDVVHNLTIPDGNYNIYQLSERIQSLITLNGGIGSNISIIPNFPELKIILSIEPGSLYEVDLSTSNFYTLLGFTEAQATGGNITVTTQGDLVGDITNGIDNIYINCNLIRGSWFNSKSSNVLYSYVPESPPGSNLNIVPQKVVYMPIDQQTDYIRSIRIWQTDNLDRSVDFNNESWQYLLHFKLIEL